MNEKRAIDTSPPRVLVRLFARLSLWFLLFFILLSGFQTAFKADALLSDASLRYRSPLTATQADAARRYAIEKRETLGLWPSFWTQRALEAESELHKAEMEAIFFSGEGQSIYPANYLSGTCPGFLDEGGCALSQKAAWQLFGSADVLGKELLAEGKRYLVRGVFEGDSPLLLLSEGQRAPRLGWQAMELSGLQENGREQANAFSQNAGLGPPQTLLWAGSFKILFGLAVWLPVSLLLAACAVSLAGAYRPWVTARGQVALFLAALLFALLLPLLLRQIPSFYLPSRWSDFGYWAGLWQQGKESLLQFLSLTPGARDVQLKLALLRQAALFAAGLLVSTLLCRSLLSRVNGHNKRGSSGHSALCHARGLSRARSFAPSCAQQLESPVIDSDGHL
ncbi:ABC transporter permease [Ruminococcaceae bacterium OttesenSCG-928-I18]|nr:ABC transporter permease [Ruminococcaceae bacterium OttesenSCG-928-I18]